MSNSNQQRVAPVGSHIGSVLWVIAPWMLLATTLRTFGVVTLPSGMLLFFGAELALFIAFLLASQRWIEITGGAVSYARLDIMRQVAMAKGILVRLALIGFAAHYIAWFLRLESVYRTPLVYGFDAIAFNRFNDFTLIWGPLIATVSYLMVVDLAMGRRATFLSAARQLIRHWRYLLPAVLALIPALALFNTVQWSIGPVLGAMSEQFASTFLTAQVSILYLFVFASLRLAGTIAVLTFALWLSYRTDRT